MFGALTKLFAIFSKNFKLCNQIPPCFPVLDVKIPFMILFCEYMIVFVFQPARGGKKATTRLAEAAAGKKLFASTVSAASSVDESETETETSTSSEGTDADGGGGGGGGGVMKGGRVAPA